MLKDIPLPIQIRLRTIEVLLIQYGFVNRVVLCDLFGIGDAAVSKDISLYKKLNKAGCFYNRSSRRIEKLSDFERIFE